MIIMITVLLVLPIIIYWLVPPPKKDNEDEWAIKPVENLKVNYKAEIAVVLIVCVGIGWLVLLGVNKGVLSWL